jgi:catalase
MNMLVFVNKAGQRRPSAIPEKVVHLDKGEAAKLTRVYLIEEPPARLKQGPVTFGFKAQLAAAGDCTKGSSRPGPDNRVLTIDRGRGER